MITFLVVVVVFALILVCTFQQYAHCGYNAEMKILALYAKAWTAKNFWWRLKEFKSTKHFDALDLHDMLVISMFMEALDKEWPQRCDVVSLDYSVIPDLNWIIIKIRDLRHQVFFRV